MSSTQVNLVLLVIGASVLTLGLFSRPLQRFGVPGPLLLMAAGAAIGPSGAGLLDVRAWGDSHFLIHEAARLSLAIGLMDVALRLPRSFIKTWWRSITVLTASSTLFMWFSSAAIVVWLLGWPVWEALLLGAIITPTDPVVASSLVTGPVAERHLPERLRHALSSEAGFNDGLALPCVLLPILWLSGGAEGAITTWLMEVVVWEVGVGALGGALLGYGCGKLLRFARDRGFMETPSILAFAAALALVTLSLMRFVGTDGVLAVFIAGLAFDRAVSPDQQEREEQVVAGIDHFFTLPIFALLGAMLPWQAWAEMGWRAPALVAAVMLGRRLPLGALLARRLGVLPSWRDGLWTGWFGPIGVAALFYATLAMRRAEVDHIWPLVSLIVCASVTLHGLSAAPLTRLYGRVARASEPSARA